MTRYVYTGPLSSLRLDDGVKVRLMPGAELELPDAKRVSVLRSRGLLTELPAEALESATAGPVPTTPGRSGSSTVPSNDSAAQAPSGSSGKTKPSTESTRE